MNIWGAKKVTEDYGVISVLTVKAEQIIMKNTKH